ncbi:MAG: CDP-diacylglycerol--glycerol-3-phosphate 3-phosphatidyltransferase [Pseudomonadales bacterium]|nr:CDP-diacylglycerol--glycerol-3-phosphate 3-phosphatidyltransferase [Pseudomonadales bacterium]
MNIPNALTLIRIVLIPVFVLFFYLPLSWSHWAAALVFWLAGFTDMLDGYFARKLNQTTPFGAFLDPVADKLMVVISLSLLIEQMASLLFTIPAIVIIGREIIISALREWMAELGARDTVAVSNVGKAKTMLQMFAIWLFIMLPGLPSWLMLIAYIIFYIAAALTLWSMINYLKAAWPKLMAKD